MTEEPFQHPTSLRDQRTQGFLAISLGIVGLAGGGLLSGVAHWLLVVADQYPGAGNALGMAVVIALPLLALGGVAAWLGSAARDSADHTAAVTGRVGRILGLVTLAAAVVQSLVVLGA